MYQIAKGKNKSLQTLNDEHYLFIVKPYLGKSGKTLYKNGSIVLRIKRKITALSGKKGVSFFKDLLENNNLLLDRILKGNPRVLQSFINEFESKIKKRKLPALNTVIIGKTFKEHISSIFNYDTLMEKSDDINGYDGYFLANELGINACPYCNRSYTITVTNNKAKIARPEFDHFFCQKYYPYLAVSFYNLIPSCHICNSNIKRDDKFSTSKNYHPYLQNFNDLYKFTVEFDKKSKNDKSKLINIRLFYSEVNSFKLTLIPNPGISSADIKRGKNHIENFKLNELYKFHKDLVIEYIHNAIVNNDSKITTLYNKYQGKLFSSKDDVKRFVTMNYTNLNELHLRPFSKLSRDIHKEFKMKL